MIAAHWTDPLVLVLLGGILLVVGVVLARFARERRRDGTNVRKP